MLGSILGSPYCGETTIWYQVYTVKGSKVQDIGLRYGLGTRVYGWIWVVEMRFLGPGASGIRFWVCFFGGPKGPGAWVEGVRCRV